MIAPLFVALAALQGGREPMADVTSVPFGGIVRGATYVDVDGDGLGDLVAMTSHDRSRFGRSVHIRYGRAGTDGFDEGLRVELTPDVTAWAVGDVHPDAGSELVLFHAGGAFAWRPRASDEERFVRLVDAPFLWQLPEPDEAFHWADGVRDVDGDGLVDLVLPESEGWRIVLQDRGAADGVEVARFERSSRPTVPPGLGPDGTWVSANGDRAAWRGNRSSNELSLSLSVEAGVDDEYRLPETLLAVTESVPAPQMVDWDADGDLDLICQTSASLHVWIQGEKGAFPSPPSRTYELPVTADRDRKLDVSYSSHALDLNRDQRADCVVFAGDQRSEEARTQSLVFVQGGRGTSAEEPLFGPKGLPQSLLVFAGFVSRASFQDVDGDSYPDLVTRTVRPDLIDQLRSVSSQSIEADLFVFTNRKGVFGSRPDLRWRYQIPLRRFRMTTQFLGDVTGDGVSELLVRDDPETVRLHWVRPPRGGEGLEVFAKPLWELGVYKRAQLELVAVPGRALPDLLVIERYQVLHVRFRGKGR